MSASEAHRAKTRPSIQVLKSSIFKISAQKLNSYVYLHMTNELQTTTAIPGLS